MVLRLRRQVGSLESDAAKTNHYAAKYLKASVLVAVLVMKTVIASKTSRHVC